MAEIAKQLLESMKLTANPQDQEKKEKAA